MNKKFKIISLIICALGLAYFTRGFFYYTAALVTSSFITPFYCLTGTISSISGIFAIDCYLINQYVRSFKKKEKVRKAIISSILAVVSLLLFAISSKQHFGNLSSGVDMYLIGIVAPISSIIILATNIYVFTNLKNEENEVQPVVVMNLPTRIFAVILSLYAGYGLMCLLLSCIVFENITKYALGFLSLIYLFLLMVFNFVYIILNSIKKCNKLQLINLIANVAGVVIFVLAEVIHFNFMCEVGKPFCPIDFAISIAILPALIAVMIVSMIAYFVIQKIKKEHN